MREYQYRDPRIPIQHTRPNDKNRLETGHAATWRNLKFIMH